MVNFICLAGPQRKHKKKELFKLIAARTDFFGARDSCTHLLEMSPNPGDGLNYALTVAAIVCYSRPFTANEPYGALPKRYVRALEEDKKKFHETVLDARHRVFAHTDLNNRNAYIYPAGSVVATGPSELRSAKISSAFSTKLYPPGFFEKLLRLTYDMHRAVGEDVERIIDDLYGSMELDPMRFPLRINNGL